MDDLHLSKNMVKYFWMNQFVFHRNLKENSWNAEVTLSKDSVYPFVYPFETGFYHIKNNHLQILASVFILKVP